MSELSSLVLSPAEIYELTHYRRPKEMRALNEMGIPARLRHDNTICVLRMHVTQPTEKPESPRPRLKLD